MASQLRGDCVEFRSKSKELCALTYSEREDAINRLSSILNCLNSLDYSVKICDTDEADRTLVQCCKLVPLSHHMLVAKLCELIVNITSKQQISLSVHGYDCVMMYMIHALRSAQTWLFVDLLRALGSLLYQSGSRAEQYCTALIGEDRILVTLALSSHDEDVKRAAIQCLENMCMRGLDGSAMTEDNLRICCDTFLHVLYDPRFSGMTDLGYCRILVAAFRGLSHALSNHKNFLQDRLGEILGAVKVFMLYNGESVVLTPIFATLISQQEMKSSTMAAPKKPAGDLKKKKKRKKKEPKEEAVDQQEPVVVEQALQECRSDDEGEYSQQSVFRISSESEYSDPEGSSSTKLRSYVTKARISALGCLNAAAKSNERRLVFGYWTHFLPDTRNSSSLNLFTCVHKERNHKCKLAALTALNGLLDGSKQFLIAAEESDTKSAFTAYSSTLGCIVREIHSNLLHALCTEQMAQVITHIIKSLGVLVENTNYLRLHPGLLTRVVQQVRPFLTHRDTNIRVACLTCIGAVLSVQAPLVEVAQIFTRQYANRSTSFVDGESKRESSSLSVTPGDRTPQRQGLSTTTPPGDRTPQRSGFMTPISSPAGVNWLVVVCARNINYRLLYPDLDRQYEPLPVRLESLQVLTRLVRGYFSCVESDFTLLEDIVVFCLQDKEPPMQLHGAKLLEALGLVLNPIQPSDGPPVGRPSLDLGAQFWCKVLSGPLSSLLQSCCVSVVRAAGCDCLSTIGADILARLPVHLRTLCLTLLLGFTSDSDHVTRSSAVRTLGVYVVYPCLRDDVSFVADVANSVLVLLKDSSVIVRTKSAWSLGNVSDAMCANKESNDAEFVEDFSDLLLMKMIEGALASSQDNDKVRIHAVRALGNILRYMPARPIEKPRMSDLVAQAVQTLVKNVGTGAMKVRWNACYALGNVLRNEILPIGKADWTAAIFSCLSIAVRDSKNFKVRINAALALCQVQSRKQLQGFGDQIEMIWSSLVKSLESMDAVTDFADFKLRDKLPDQVCCTLVHLTLLLEFCDLPAISKIVSTNLMLITESMVKFWANLDKEPERGQWVKKALDHLAEMKVNCSDEYAMITIQNLVSAFSWSEAVSNPCEDDSDLSWQIQSSQSAFRDTYD